MAVAKKNKKNLVIVESPSKAKTIGKFLGSRYKAVSYTHLCKSVSTGACYRRLLRLLFWEQMENLLQWKRICSRGYRLSIW